MIFLTLERVKTFSFINVSIYNITICSNKKVFSTQVDKNN